MIINSPSVQSPKAYDLINLQGAQLGARLAAAAGAALRANLRVALQDVGYNYQIHPSETAAGLVEANLTFGHAVGDVRRYGAVGDGVANDGPAFQTAIFVARKTVAGVLTGTGGRVYVPRPPVAGKFYLITQALDVSISAQPNDPGVTIIGDGGSIGAPYIVLKHTGHGFDLTGANRVTFADLSIGTDTVTVPKTIFLAARNSTKGSAGHHTFFNVAAIGYASNAIYYNYASEDDKLTDCVFYNFSLAAGTAVCVWSANNRFAMTSTFQVIASGPAISCIDHQVNGGEFLSLSQSATSDVFYLDQSDYVRLLNLWVNGSGRSIIFIDGSIASTNFLMIHGVEVENSAPRANYSIRVTNDAQVHSQWYIAHSKLSSAVFSIDVQPLATLDSAYIDHISEVTSQGFAFEGTMQSSYVNAGFMLMTVGTSKNNTLVGDSSRWTIGARTDDYWIDQGTVNKTWTPVLGAGFTVTGALTISNKKMLKFGNLCFVTATFSAATSIVSTAGAVITGAPPATVRAAASLLQSDTPGPAIPAAVVGANIVCGVVNVGANVSVTVSAVYPIA